MTRIYKIQRKHGVKWYAKVNYTIAGIHYQKKSPVFDTQKEARCTDLWTGMGRVPKHAQNQRIEA